MILLIVVIITIVTLLSISIMTEHSKLKRELSTSYNSIDGLRTRLGELDRIVESHIEQTGFKITECNRDYGLPSWSRTGVKKVVPKTDEDIEITELKKRIKELKQKNEKGNK